MTEWRVDLNHMGHMDVIQKILSSQEHTKSAQCNLKIQNVVLIQLKAHVILHLVFVYFRSRTKRGNVVPLQKV